MDKSVEKSVPGINEIINKAALNLEFKSKYTSEQVDVIGNEETFPYTQGLAWVKLYLMRHLEYMQITLDELEASRESIEKKIEEMDEILFLIEEKRKELQEEKVKNVKEYEEESDIVGHVTYEWSWYNPPRGRQKEVSETLLS
ncbi:MAG: hypothetical protein ACTSXG_04475 [Alphaproteobacteria bacterium]